jgi:hypothetical protein
MEIKQKQSVFDLAIMYGYGVENIIQFIQDNPDLSGINDVSIANKQIAVTRRSTPLSDYLFLQGKILATNIDEVTVSKGNFLLNDNGGYILQDDGFKIYR